MKYKELRAQFLHETVTGIYSIYLLEVTYVIRVNSRCNNYSMDLKINKGKKIYVAFITNPDCTNRFPFDEHLHPNSCSNLSISSIDTIIHLKIALLSLF